MISLSDEYSLWAYECGFRHGQDSRIEPPCRSECDRYYWHGFNAARR